MDLVAMLNRLCTPAFLYAVVHGLLLVLQFFRALSYGTLFQSQVLSSIIVNLIWIVFWAWLLNYICSKGLSPISWLVFLTPFILMVAGASRRGGGVVIVNLMDPNPLSGLFR